MITLNLSKLRKYEKSIFLAFPYIKEGRKDNYFYFDFQNKLIKATNSNNAIQLKFSFEGEEDNPTNFYVDIHKLLYILKEDTINLEYEESDTPVFFDSNGRYAITYLPDDENSFVVPKYEEDVRVTLTIEDQKIISESSNFYLSNLEEINSSVITENRIYCSPRIHSYRNTLSFDIGEKEMSIHKNVAKILISIKEEIDIATIKGSKNTIILSNDDLLFILEENIKDILPNEEGIKSMYPQDNYFTVKRDDILNTLKFFDPFYDQDSKPVEFSIKDGLLLCAVASTEDNIKKEIELIDYTHDIEGLFSLYNASTLKLMIGLIKSNEVIFKASNNHMGVLVTEKDDDKRNMLLIKYQNPS